MGKAAGPNAFTLSCQLASPRPASPAQPGACARADRLPARYLGALAALCRRHQQIHHLSAVPWSVIPAGESSLVTKPGAPFTVPSSRKSLSATPQPGVLILSLPPCNSLQTLHGESLSRATAFCLCSREPLLGLSFQAQCPSFIPHVLLSLSPPCLCPCPIR